MHTCILFITVSQALALPVRTSRFRQTPVQQYVYQSALCISALQPPSVSAVVAHATGRHQRSVAQTSLPRIFFVESSRVQCNSPVHWRAPTLAHRPRLADYSTCYSFTFAAVLFASGQRYGLHHQANSVRACASGKADRCVCHMVPITYTRFKCLHRRARVLGPSPPPLWFPSATARTWTRGGHPDGSASPGGLGRVMGYGVKGTVVVGRRACTL